MARHELWVELADRPGNLAALAGDLAACGANIVHLDVLAGTGDTVIDRLVVQVPDHRSGELAAVARRCGRHAPPARRPRRASEPPPPQGPSSCGPPTRSPVAPPSPDPPVRRSPMTLERLVALPDGGLVRLRHLSTGDRNALVAHHGRCSETARGGTAGSCPPPSTSTTTTWWRWRPSSGGTLVGAGRYELADGGAPRRHAR